MEVFKRRLKGNRRMVAARAEDHPTQREMMDARWGSIEKMLPFLYGASWAYGRGSGTPALLKPLRRRVQLSQHPQPTSSRV